MDNEELFSRLSGRFDKLDERLDKIELSNSSILVGVRDFRKSTERQLGSIDYRLKGIEADFTGLRSDLLRHYHDKTGKVVIDPPE